MSYKTLFWLTSLIILACISGYMITNLSMTHWTNDPESLAKTLMFKSSPDLMDKVGVIISEKTSSGIGVALFADKSRTNYYLVITRSFCGGWQFLLYGKVDIPNQFGIAATESDSMNRK